MALRNTGPGGALPPGYTIDSNGSVVYAGGSPLETGPDYTGMPSSSPYNEVYNPETENLANPLSQELGTINTNPLDMSVQNFADLADRQGPSAWATTADQQQNQLAGNALERGAAQTNSQTAQALDTLGSSGGISSGARERAAEAGSTNYMSMAQDTARQNTTNQLQIGVNDQQNKMQEMGQLPGMESAALQPEFQKANMWEQANQADVGNEIAAKQSANSWNQNQYNTEMQAWGANKQADATANSGKK